MKATKNLVLTAVAALSLSAGAAMAQEVSTGPLQDYQAAKIFEARQAQTGQIQAGSSDVTSTGVGFQIGPFHSTPDRGQMTVGGDAG